MSKKFLILSLVMFLLLVTNVVYAKDVHFYDFDTAMKISMIEGKTAMVVFDSENCPYCKKLKDETLKNEKVSDILNTYYISVELVLETNEPLHFQGKELTSQMLFGGFGFKGTPVVLFFDEKNVPITMLPGYVPSDKMIPVLNFIGQRVYAKNIKFQDYLKNPISGKFKGSESYIEISDKDALFLEKNDPFVKVYDFSKEVYTMDTFKEEMKNLPKNLKYILKGSDVKLLEDLGKKMISKDFSTVLVVNPTINK